MLWTSFEPVAPSSCWGSKCTEVTQKGVHHRHVAIVDFLLQCDSFKNSSREVKCSEHSKLVPCSVIRRQQECLCIQVFHVFLRYNKPKQLYIAARWRGNAAVTAGVYFSPSENVSVL